MCPEILFHLYTIHGQRDGRIFPCVFSLLPNKNENTYSRLFEQLFQLVNNLGNGANDLLVDFERSAINAFQNRNIEVQGCFYHLSANIWKHTQHLGLSQKYNQEEEFALHIRMLPALAFLQASDVIKGFEELVDTIRILYDDVADDLLQYFEDTYIGRYRRNAPRHPPLFAINLWNIFNRTDDELQRANNSVEGWHRSFQRPRICMSSCVLEIFIRPSERRKHDSYLDCPASCGTSSTTTKTTLFGFKPRNS